MTNHADWLREQCGHDSRSVDGCGHCEAADEIERLRKLLNGRTFVTGALPTPEPTPQAPIALLTINSAGEPAGFSLYAPGLPPGEHDVYCEPKAVAPYHVDPTGKTREPPHCPTCDCATPGAPAARGESSVMLSAEDSRPRELRQTRYCDYDLCPATFDPAHSNNDH